MTHDTQELQATKAAGEEITAVGRRWDSRRPKKIACLAGRSFEEIVLKSVREAYREHGYSDRECRKLLKFARCRVNGFEIPGEAWATTFQPPGSFIEILHGVRGEGGGGGGKTLKIIDMSRQSPFKNQAKKGGKRWSKEAA